MEDGRIVELYLSRDESAIEVTSEKYGRRLRALARGILEDDMEAEECENDTYLRAWSSIPPNEPVGYLYAFLARITRNLALNRYRDRERLKRRVQLEALGQELYECVPATENVESRVDAVELGEAIDGFLAALSKEKRVAFLRRYFYFDGIREIGERLGWSDSRVKTSLHRTRRDLREYLEREGFCI